jgi:diguanylate cyclase (GGDEF)-like protein
LFLIRRQLFPLMSSTENFKLRFRLLLLSVVTIMALADAGWALDPSKAITQYIHNSWSSAQGLPQNSVMAIRQTKDGYLWLGTQEGLVRFDGINFRVSDRQNTNGLLSNDIRALEVTANGVLWVGTWGGGLTRIDGERFTSFTTRDGLPNDFINVIALDASGVLWVGTNSGLACLDRSAPNRFQVMPEFSGQIIRSILPVRSGGIWVGTSNSALYRSQAGSKFQRDRSFPADGITALFEDRDSDLWVGTSRHGLLHLHDGRVVSIPSGEINAIVQDRDGNVWAGATHGLLRIHGAASAWYRAADGLGDDFVCAVQEDREGSLWVGTSSDGLHRFKEGKFTPITKREGLSGDYVRVVLPARDGTVWVGTYGAGLNHLVGGKIEHFSTRDGLADDNIRSLAEGTKGEMWIATMSGLCRLSGRKMLCFDERQGLRAHFIWSVLVDSQGDLWIGPDGGGIHRWRAADPRQSKTWATPIQQSVRCIYEDHAGRIWMGTLGDGLWVFDGSTFTRRAKSDGLADNTVFAIHEDPEGALWIGTNGGLSRLKDNKLTTFSHKDGLFSDTIFQVIEDDLAYLWMTCNTGIFRVSRKELDAVAAGSGRTFACKAYGLSDGLLSTECNGGWPAGSRLANGLLAFPTIRGVAIIDPKNIKLNAPPPPVFVDSILADDQPVKVAPHITLGPNLRRLRISYSSLTLLAPEGVEYSYRLEGLDEKWEKPDRAHTADYKNLQPGLYMFKVRAGNSDGLWNNDGYAMEIEVRRSVYQTIWFQGICLALVFALPLTGYRLRIRRIRRREAALQTMVEEKTTELRQANATLATVNQQLEELSIRDPLTGLFNRRYFAAVLESEWRRTGRVRGLLAIIMLDVDHFKLFNDTYGHVAGDECLRRVAGAISFVNREGDLLVRYGGEEFVAILQDADLDGALLVAEKMRAGVEQLAISHTASPTAAHATISLGVASCVPMPGLVAEDLLAAADHALYLAKKQGRNRTVAAASLKPKAIT